MTPLAKLSRRSSSKALTIIRDAPEVLDDGSLFYARTATQASADWAGDRDGTEQSYDSFARALYKSNPIVFACVQARQLPFSEARFQFQEMRGGRPGRMFGTEALRVLEQPWVNATTGELLSRMEQDASLAGNFYATLVGDGPDARIRRLRPDWVSIVTGSKNPFALESHVLMYIYHPGGEGSGHNPVMLTPDRVVHYSPIPDPDAQWRGMSWLTPLVREVQADAFATIHKQKFFENGAALNTVISYDATVNPDSFRRYVDMFEDAHRGVDNAYKTLHIGGGADATVIGTELKTDFRAIQGAGETRIAAAAGVGSIIARFSEGLAGSSLNQGNYNAAKRQFADMTLRPLWRMASASLSKFVSPPSGSRLTYDTRDVEFLKDDRSEAADTLQKTASTMNSLVSAGYTPDSVVVAVETGDLTRLVHSGLYSIQLQSPGSSVPPAPAA